MKMKSLVLMSALSFAGFARADIPNAIELSMSVPGQEIPIEKTIPVPAVGTKHIDVSVNQGDAECVMSANLGWENGQLASAFVIIEAKKTGAYSNAATTFHFGPQTKFFDWLTTGASEDFSCAVFYQVPTPKP